MSIEDFESDLKNNLYNIWNRMSSGTYFPPPVPPRWHCLMAACKSGTGGPHKVGYVQLNISRLMNSAGLCAAGACRAW